MEFHGYPTIAAYEKAARECGIDVKRVPFTHMTGSEYFILVTSCNGGRSWRLFDKSETHELLCGFFGDNTPNRPRVMVNGMECNGLGRLYDFGFYSSVPGYTVEQPTEDEPGARFNRLFRALWVSMADGTNSAADVAALGERFDRLAGTKEGREALQTIANTWHHNFNVSGNLMLDSDSWAKYNRAAFVQAVTIMRATAHLPKNVKRKTAA